MSKKYTMQRYNKYLYFFAEKDVILNIIRKKGKTE